MARGQTIKFLRTTRANLETQKTASGLILGEPYLITDENRIAIATATNAYYDFALKSELPTLPVKASGAEVNTGTDDAKFVTAKALADSDYKKTKTIRIPHTFTVSGEIKVPSGDTDFICPFFVKLPTGQTGKLVSCRYKINSGTSVTAKLTENGTDITGFTSISVTTTAAETDPTDVTLADNDLLALVVTAVSGTPKNMSFTLFIDYTV